MAYITTPPTPANYHWNISKFDKKVNKQLQLQSGIKNRSYFLFNILL
jgi:hypothetical protein